MESKRQKSAGKLWKWLAFPLLAAIAFFPTDMLAASSDDLAGTWTASGMHPSGAFVKSTLSLNTNGSGSFTMYMNGNLANSTSFTWSVSDDMFCSKESNGNSICMNIESVTSNSLALRTPTGKLVSYSRAGYQVPFGYARNNACTGRGCFCKKYEAKGLVNSDCKNCPHSIGFHPDAKK